MTRWFGERAAWMVGCGRRPDTRQREGRPLRQNVVVTPPKQICFHQRLVADPWLTRRRIACHLAPPYHPAEVDDVRQDRLRLPRIELVSSARFIAPTLTVVPAHLADVHL